ncbi:MAG TPA: flagellar protein FliT [Gammaproteobacteria bacterium]|nr:flagellar protein FliT [Gammaproteobacteria bacterium]
MPAISPQSHVQNILRISHEMYGQAKQGDWATFTRLEAKREKIITALFAHPHINVMLETLAATLRQVMTIDNKSMALGEREKQRLAGEMAGLNQHHQAARVYQLASMNESLSS